jgi:hypothetical protein
MNCANATAAAGQRQSQFEPPGKVQVPAGTFGLLHAAREILKGLRRAYLFETDLRLALMILEWGPCHGRDAAVFPRHQDIADLDGELDRAQVTRAIGRLRVRKIIEESGGVYSFRPPGEWRVKSRAREGRQEAQAQLELRFERLAQQLDLNLYELDAALKEDFLAGAKNPACVSETHGRVAETPGACVSETHKRVSQTPARVPQNPRGVAETPNDTPLKEDLKDSKLKALRGTDAEKQFMARVEAFLGSDAYENDGGKWRVRYRGEKRGKCLRVIAAMEEDVKAGKGIRSRPAHMEWTWNDFAD